MIDKGADLFPRESQTVTRRYHLFGIWRKNMKKLTLTLLTSAIALWSVSTVQAGEIAVIVKTVNSTFWQNVQ